MEIFFQWLPALYLSLLGMGFIWFLSVLTRDASLVDRFWGLGFILLSGTYYLQADTVTLRGKLMMLLVTLWGLRLSWYLHFRNSGKGEDKRYAAMRAKRPKTFWWWSLFGIFGLQGLLMAIIASPLLIVYVRAQHAELTLYDTAGLTLWMVGFFFEAIGDNQLTLFKHDPANKGKVLNTGLWALTRHPNYFGESLMWWGYFVMALNVSGGHLTLISPVLITWLLLKISGVALLEKDLISKPGYKEYVENVPAFFPFGKKRSSR